MLSTTTTTWHAGSILTRLRDRRVFTALLALVVAILFFLARFTQFRFGGGTSCKKRPGGIKKSSSVPKPSRGTSKPTRDHASSKRRKMDKHLPTMIVLVGIHGSGKTSWARQYIEQVHKSYIHISSDALRSTITGTISDYSKEQEVEAALLAEVKKNVELKRCFIVDDCHHNLAAAFRASLLELAKEGEYNRVVRVFPIKPMFAHTRLDKDIADGKVRYVPLAEEMEALSMKYTESEPLLKTEGWIKDN